MSKPYIEQMTVKMGFDEIGRAIAINILDFSFLPFEEYHNRYRMKNTRNNHELTEVFEMNFLELPKTPKEKGKNFKDWWMQFLSADKEEVLDMLANESPVFEKAVNKLLYVSADEQLRYELDMREKAELDYWSAMKTNYRKGRLEGEAKGRLEGRLEGEAKGRLEGRLEGEAEGRIKGAEEKAYTAAERALRRGAKPEDIAYDLELPLEVVHEIQAKLQ